MAKNYEGMDPEIKKKYKEAARNMNASGLFEEYEALAHRNSTGYRDPITEDMLKITRKELINRLESKDKNFKASKNPRLHIGKSLFG